MARLILGGAALLILLVAGCGKPPPSPPPSAVKSGAEARAREFFAALLAEDWSKAYADLDPTSKAWCSKEKFIELAKAHRDQIGFTPTEVNVATSERGDSATALANFKGLSGTTNKWSKDGTTLQKTAEGWAVVLRKNFGKRASK